MNNFPITPASESGPFRGHLITDLDGTLFQSDRTVSEEDLKTLRDLKRKNMIRTIATGRSLYSFQRAGGLQLPVDYVIFSTGAGIFRCADGKILRSVNLDGASVRNAVRTLKTEGFDFMVHRPVPDNHRFAYWGSISGNPDFARRIGLYGEHCRPLDGEEDSFGRAAQLLAVVQSADKLPDIKTLQGKLPDLSIIRTTSPLDGVSTWIEFFHQRVSKSQAAAWLNDHLGIRKEQTLSVGNDYNDLDLLEWAGRSFAVANAPDELRRRFPAVASNNQSGVSEAVQKWLSSGNRKSR